MSKSKFYEVIYEDKSILVLNKESGIPVVPTRDPNEKSLVKILQSKYDQHIYVVHRIDRETSGIIVFAFSEEAHKNLNSQFYKREVVKHYLCISHGVGGSDWKTVQKKISLDGNSHKMKIDPMNGKDALSHYKSLDVSKRYSRNIVKIETGRTHQVRIHMASEALPLLGDTLYNRNPKLKLSYIKKKYVPGGKGKDERSLMRRTALHAHSLKFRHPITGMELEYEAAEPKDMRACWNQISKWDT